MADDQVKQPAPDESEVEQKPDKKEQKVDNKKDQKAKNGKNGKNGKKKEPGKVRRWFKDFFSELKKVTWPTFAKVLKQTGTVLLVTVIFLLVMLAFDSLLGFGYRALIGKLGEDSVTALSTLLGGGGGLL